MSSVHFSSIHQTAYSARRSVLGGQNVEKKLKESEKLARKEKAYRDWAHQVSTVGSDVMIFGLPPDRSQSCLAKFVSNGETEDAPTDEGAPVNDEDRFLGGDEDDIQELDDDDNDVDDDNDDDDDELDLGRHDIGAFELLSAPQDMGSNASSPNSRGLGYTDMNTGLAYLDDDDDDDDMNLD